MLGGPSRRIEFARCRGTRGGGSTRAESPQPAAAHQVCSWPPGRPRMAHGLRLPEGLRVRSEHNERPRHQTEVSNMRKSDKGFTLIELMIVVVIIGILAAIAIPNFIAMQDRAKEGSVKANMHTLQLAAEDYGVQNDGVYCGVATAAGAAGLSARLPGNFKNPFGGATVIEDRGSFAADPGTTRGLA